jgi:hypothetical protein
VTLPHQGKFNAAEKINFIVVLSTYPLYIATGLAIWFLRPAYLSWMIHFSMATLATPLVLGHVFMATVNPDTRAGLKGMISGWVSREWARHHYRHWYDEHFGRHEHAADAGAGMEAAPRALPVPAPPPDQTPRVTQRPLVPAAAVTAKPQAARPATILWPPDARTADPSFAS